jgi:holo-[acyl-carrier protein] synthase
MSDGLSKKNKHILNTAASGTGNGTGSFTGIFGIGTDIIEVSRVKKAIQKSSSFLQKVFTRGEINYCNSKKNPDLIYISFAQRFAAKEAILKALGVGVLGGISLNEVEIVNNSRGKPTVIMHGRAQQFLREKNISGIELSLSGVKEFAAAFAISFRC